VNKNAVIAALGAFLIGMAYFGVFIDYGINLDDEGSILYQIERTADGETPYTDFHVGYTPANFYAQAAVMRAFGHSVMPIRWLLAIVNSISLAGMVLLASAVAPTGLALLPALLYMVAIPVHTGEFAAFNIPYPVWYNTAFFVWSMFCALRFGEGGRLVWLGAAAALAGLNFTFKPNAGLFNLAAVSFVALSVVPYSAAAARPALRAVARVWWALLWVGTLAGIGVVYAGNAGPREIGIFLLPALAGALVVAWRSMVTTPAPGRPGIIAASIVLLGTFWLVNLPWMIPVYLLLGRQRFLEQILFVGTGFEKFYFIAHPPVLAVALLTLVVAGLMAVLPRMVRGRRVPVDVVSVGAAALAGGALLVAARVSLMPEGFLNAVRSEFEARSLGVTLALNLLGVVLWASRIRVDEARRLSSIRVGVVVLGALTMYLQLYPRTDYMHWVTAAPLSLVIGVALWASFVDRWTASVTGRRRTVARVACALPLVAVIALRVAPALDAVFDLDGVVPRAAPMVRLQAERAPVRVNAGRAERYRHLDQVVAYLRENTEPDEKVFTFPNLDVVSFLSGRDNPTRHGYFYPGWPGRDVEAEVVSDLLAEPPPLAVILQREALFFLNAPVFYYTLRDFMESRYRPHAAFGPYAVVAREGTHDRPGATVDTGAGAAQSSAAPVGMVDGLGSASTARRIAALARADQIVLESYDAAVAAALDDPEQTVRDAAVWAVRWCRDPRCARALVRAVRRRALSKRESVLALRTAGTFGAPDIATDLVAVALGGHGRVANTAATALYHMSTRAVARSFWFLHEPSAAESAPRLPRAPGLRRSIRRWIADEDFDPRFRLYAIWAAADMDEHAAPYLEKAARYGDVEGATLALLVLARRGDSVGLAGRALDLLGADQMLAPNAVLAFADHGRALDRRVAAHIVAADPEVRAQSAWLAARVGGERTVSALVASLGDPDPEIRKAAIWALQYRRDRAHLEAIERLRNDDDHGVRAFAERAVADLLGGSSS